MLSFPEPFVPGYATCIWHCIPLGNAHFIHEYVRNSLIRASPEMGKIRDAVKVAGLYVVVADSERDGGSIYMAQVCLEPCPFLFLGRKTNNRKSF